MSAQSEWGMQKSSAENSVYVNMRHAQIVHWITTGKYHNIVNDTRKRLRSLIRWFQKDNLTFIGLQKHFVFVFCDVRNSDFFSAWAALVLQALKYRRSPNVCAVWLKKCVRTSYSSPVQRYFGGMSP